MWEGLQNKISNKSKTLLLDGAIGSLIQQYGGQSDKYLWTSIANLLQPELVKKIYNGYIDSGCDIITTNTFRTNPVALLESTEDIDVTDFVRDSLNLCKEVVGDKKILIAGSNAPAEDCYTKIRNVALPVLEYNHKKHIELLWENGCDLILNETQSHFDEIKIICEFCYSNKIPWIMSLYVDEELNLLSEEKIYEVLDFIKEYNPLCLSINCVSIKTFEKLSKFTNENFSFYLNCGSGHHTDKNIDCGIDSKLYLDSIKDYINSNTHFIGACCGSNFSHIKTLRSYLDSLY